jgi:sortase (surface protein transpeptidase)
VALAVVGTACIGAVLNHSSGPGEDTARPMASASADPSVRVARTPRLTAAPPSPRSTRATPSPSASASSPGTPATPVARALPTHLAIPAIGVSQKLLTLGLRPDRTVEVPAPSDAAYPGWYRLGPTPGQVGSAVILGHVDSLQGPAVFYQLRYLEQGSRVDVRLRNGAVAHFEVQRVATYPNDEFPARQVYSSHGYPALNLVTCGGAYDKANGGYQSNVVAYTRLVGSTPGTAS